jgi:hypothetical protein
MEDLRSILVEERSNLLLLCLRASFSGSLPVSIFGLAQARIQSLGCLVSCGDVPTLTHGTRLAYAFASEGL